jgi:hypothetical protein
VGVEIEAGWMRAMGLQDGKLVCVDVTTLLFLQLAWLGLA